MEIFIFKEYTVDTYENGDGYSFRILYGDSVVIKDEGVYEYQNDAFQQGLYELRSKLYRGELHEVYVPQIDKHYRSSA